MNTKETAEYIGCSVYQVRWLIRKGRLTATKVPTKENQWGYEYRINKSAANKAKNDKTRRPRK